MRDARTLTTGSDRHDIRRAPRRPQRRARGQAGQALVEFALIIPVFLLIFFGAIEFSLIVASVGGFNFAARDAARVGTFIGRSNPNADAMIVSDANSRVQALVMAKGIELDIYRATSDGQCYTTPSGSGSTVSVALASCAADRYNMDGTVYGGSSALWPVGDRDDTLENADYLGVRIVFQYNWLTAFVADTGVPLQLSATSVQRIEPLQFTHLRPAVPLAAVWSQISFVSALRGAVPGFMTAMHLALPDIWRRAPAQATHWGGRA